VRPAARGTYPAELKPQLGRTGQDPCARQNIPSPAIEPMWLQVPIFGFCSPEAERGPDRADFLEPRQLVASSTTLGMHDTPPSGVP